MIRQAKKPFGVYVGFILLASLAMLLGTQPGRAAQGTPLVLVLTANGPITSAMSQYLSRGIQTAEQRGAELVVFQFNTPGGAITTMDEMTGSIQSSKVPVVVYVWPAGRMDASAGAIITLSANASAMAPNTVIGASSPVGASGQDLAQTESAKQKAIQDSKIEAFTARRPPAATELAKSMVDTAQAVTASQALQIGLVDFVATDLNDLLRQMNGFKVFVQGQEVTLQTDPAQVENLPISFIEQLLQFLTDPNIVFSLLTIGVMAILIELSNPGAWVPGFVGAICLALSAYGLGILPVNWFGLVFLAIAFVLFILDIKAPTHGALTAAGVGSLIVAGLVLFNSPGTPAFTHVSVPFVVILSLFTAAFFFIILTIGIRAQRRPVQVSSETLVGRSGIARSDLNPKGSVQVASELWSAETEEGANPIVKGTHVKVIKVDGIKVMVRKEEENL